MSTSFSSKPDWLQFEGGSGGWGDDDAPVIDAQGNIVPEPAPLHKSWKFYDGEFEIFFDPEPHVYYRYINGVRKDIDGVTTVLGVIDKPFLKAWAVKLAINHLREMIIRPDGSIREFSTEDLLRWFDEAKGKHKEKLDEAGNIGTLAHNTLEDSILHAIEFTNGVVKTCPTVIPDEFFVVPEANIVKAQNCVNRAYEWMVAHNVRWLHTERKIYSRAYDYSGTLDGDAMVDSCTDKFCKGCRGRVFKGRRAITDWKSSNQLSDGYAYQTAAYLFAHTEEFEDLYIPDRWILRLGKEEGDFEPWYIPSEYFEADFEAFLSALQLYRSLDEIEERRRTENKAFTTFVRATKKAEREHKEAEEKEAKRIAREELKEAKAAWDKDKKDHYKKLRAEKVPKAEAESVTEAAYPKENRPGANEVVDITNLLPENYHTVSSETKADIMAKIFNMATVNEQDIPEAFSNPVVAKNDNTVTQTQATRKPVFIPGVDKKADVSVPKGSWKMSSRK